MTLPESHQNFYQSAHKCAELYVQPFKWLWSSKLFWFHGQMQSPSSPKVPVFVLVLACCCTWWNGKTAVIFIMPDSPREPALRKWSDAWRPPSANFACLPNLSSECSSFVTAISGLEMLFNYVYFTIFVNQPRVQPWTLLDAVIETMWPNIRSVTLGARLWGAHPPLKPHHCIIILEIGHANRKTTMVTVSSLVATTAAAVVATAATVMTAPTKTWQWQWGEIFTMKTFNNQSSSNTKIEHTTFHQRPTWEQTAINQVEIKRALNNQLPCLVHSTHAITNGVATG